MAVTLSVMNDGLTPFLMSQSNSKASMPRGGSCCKVISSYIVIPRENTSVYIQKNLVSYIYISIDNNSSFVV